MPAERNAFRLGLVMILFLVLFVGVLVFFAPSGGGDVTFRVRYPHNRLSTVLKPGNLVRCGGDTVGSVTALDLEEMKDSASGLSTLYAVVTFKISSKVDLRQDCVITPIPQLVGEGSQLVIQDRGDARKLTEGATVDGNPGADLAGLMQIINDQLNTKDPNSLLAMIRMQFNSGDPKSMAAKLLRSLDDINRITATMSREFDPQEKAALLTQIHGIMDNINEATRLLRDQMDQTKDAAMMAKMGRALDTLQGGLQTAVTILNDNREPLNQTVASIRNTSAILERDIATRIARQLDTSDAASLLAKVHVSIDRLSRSLADMNAITGTAKEVAVLNKEQISTTLTNFKETSDHLKGAALEIRRSPVAIALSADDGGGLGGEPYSTRRGRFRKRRRIWMTRRLVFRLPRPPRTANRPIGDAEMVRIREQLQQTLGNFSKAEAALWQQLKIK